MELSKRLQAVADMVTEEVVADLGTDHGYIPIYLIQSDKCKKVFAMDINEGPYKKAKLHIAGYGLSNQITTRLSDGMKALNPGEATSIIIAGMGGGLVIKILNQDRRLWDEINEFILQPQSEIHKVRQFLQENNLKIIEENMVYEDGKYYPMMRVVKGKEEIYSECELLYGRQLILNNNPILKAFIDKELLVKEGILKKLNHQYCEMMEEHKTGGDLLESDSRGEIELYIEDSKVRDKIMAIKERMDEITREVNIAYEVQRSM